MIEKQRIEREAQAVRDRYARRRDDFSETSLYHPSRPERLVSRHEKERVVAEFVHRKWFGHIGQLRVLEIGCEGGGTLQILQNLGFSAANMTGVELLAHHAALARAALPASATIIEADALEVDLPHGEFDLVVQSTLFSSILDTQVRAELARRMERWRRPGGAILWYDLRVDNPRNPDVRGISNAGVRALFAGSRSFRFRRMTLAPPIARMAARAGGYRLCATLSAMPLLRSHLLGWIE